MYSVSRSHLYRQVKEEVFARIMFIVNSGITDKETVFTDRFTICKVWW